MNFESVRSLANENASSTPPLSRHVLRALVDIFRGDRSWQLFGLHQNAKDGSYTAPTAFSTLAAVHKHSHLPGAPNQAASPLRWFSLAAAVGLVATTGLGIVMAFRSTKNLWQVTLCLCTGTLAPVALLFMYR